MSTTRANDDVPAGRSAAAPRSGPAASAGRGRRLRPRTRKGVLVVHIVSAGAWIGIDVILAVLVFTALGTDDIRTVALSYQALGFVVWPLLASGLVCLGSGIALGLGTAYGLVRYWWVATKLALNVVLCVLIVILLRPEVAQAVANGRLVADGAATPIPVGQLVFPPIVSMTALLVATILAVYKPWGRLARRLT